ncbi:ABC transporter ATP-binding protein [Thalassotalea eurytherma]|uniref:ABC transporter ATP-binding protein n=1 Tax=Thalassotalea eurytherma TaxID=1144278 RepID=A0ABQ6GZC6_9GAMM|nr:ABC transporter ATP-binding protein [Thalassotalea eurytherma]GLX81308.1 ABC transporter ATP-binding protein [Thalassotalea eurytherma]
MIQIQNLTKSYPSSLGEQYVFNNLNFDIPSDHNIALLGKNGAGKSTLFRLIAGSEYPNKGKIKSNKTLSWPVSLSTGIHPQMTGRENVRFIGRINGVNDLVEYESRVQRFAQLGKKFDLPVKSYSSGMRSKLAFGCCVEIDFDIYLIDEATSVGDQQFRRKARQKLINKSKEANVILVSHELSEIRLFCDSAIILDGGTLTFYNDLEAALAIYEEL